MIFKSLFFIFLFSVAFAEINLTKWQQFKRKYNKVYSNQDEEDTRFNIFKSNLQQIEEHNAKYEAGEVSWFKTVNQFSDLTREEFTAWLTKSHAGKPDIKPVSTFEATSDAGVPASFDWRTKGAVTPVKDQGRCGSCWSFATTGAVEGAYFIKNKKLISFSEQQLIDCSQGAPYLMGGCRGGWSYVGIKYAADHGLETETDYPFTGVNGNCTYDSSKVVTKVKGYVGVPSKDAAALKKAIAHHAPVAVAIDATYLDSYGGGIYESSQCTNCDSCMTHDVLAVGYGTANGTDYWIIKNSWTADFGESGYFRIKRGVNMCGIELGSVYATY